MIPHSFLQDLLDRVDIVEVVGRYVQLKKAGANFSGLCPFHNEKSPSFTVSPTKQFYHCFGCGAHGTAIGFLMEHAGLPFPEAVNDLAQAAGLTVPHEPGPGQMGRRAFAGDGGGAPRADSNAATTKRAVDVMQTACDYYRRQLRESPTAIAYLKRRGLTGPVAARFGLGFAPDGWQNLESAFDDYRDDVLVETGLVIVSDKQDAQGKERRYDRFRERVMFPIRNARGHVIGFGGRILDAGEPKYLNSPETSLFSKGNELYGLFEARLPIREQGFALVVEGYMDVVALAQLGFPNAVATLGTACTPVHVQKLVRQTERIVFSFDGDAAGRRAARRALEASLPHAADNREIAFLFLPAEHDPDSFIRERGTEAFGAAVAGATPLSEFLIAEALGGKELERPEGRAKALFDAKPLLQALPANALRVQILHEIANRLKVPIGEVASLCAVDERVVAPRRAAAPVSERRRVTGSERRALRNLVMHPRLALRLDEAALQVITECAHHRPLFEEVIAHAQELGERAEFRLLSDVLRNSENVSTYEEIFREILVYDENVRDLLMAEGAVGASGATSNEHRRELEDLAFQEVDASLAKMRYDGLCERLDGLCKQARLTPEQSLEVASLSRQVAELKHSAIAKP
ncbi:MAG: DNA primase [Janthinobacterium lividum]